MSSPMKIDNDYSSTFLSQKQLSQLQQYRQDINNKNNTDKADNTHDLVMTSPTSTNLSEKFSNLSIFSGNKQRTWKEYLFGVRKKNI